MSNLSGTRGDEFERNQVANVVGVGDGRPTEKQNVERHLARCAPWPYRCGFYRSSQNRSVRSRNAQEYFGIGKFRYLVLGFSRSLTGPPTARTPSHSCT